MNIINHQYPRVSIAVVASPRCSNENRRGTSRCKKSPAFWQAVFAAQPSLVTGCSGEVVFSCVWKWVQATVCSVLRFCQLLENGKLRFVSPQWLTACLTKLSKSVSNCRRSIWAIVAWFLENSEFPQLKSESRGKLANSIFSHDLSVLRPWSAWCSGRVAQLPGHASAMSSL